MTLFSAQHAVPNHVTQPDPKKGQSPEKDETSSHQTLARAFILKTIFHIRDAFYGMHLKKQYLQPSYYFQVNTII